MFLFLEEEGEEDRSCKMKMFFFFSKIKSSLGSDGGDGLFCGVFEVVGGEDVVAGFF